LLGRRNHFAKLAGITELIGGQQRQLDQQQLDFSAPTASMATASWSYTVSRPAISRVVCVI
jgi:hypothetical protein